MPASRLPAERQQGSGLEGIRRKRCNNVHSAAGSVQFLALSASPAAPSSSLLTSWFRPFCSSATVQTVKMEARRTTEVVDRPVAFLPNGLVLSLDPSGQALINRPHPRPLRIRSCRQPRRRRQRRRPLAFWKAALDPSPFCLILSRGCSPSRCPSRPAGTLRLACSIHPNQRPFPRSIDHTHCNIHPSPLLPPFSAQLVAQAALSRRTYEASPAGRAAGLGKSFRAL